MSDIFLSDAFSDCGRVKVLREGDSTAFVALEDKSPMYLDQVKYVQQKAKEKFDVDLIVKVNQAKVTLNIWQRK